MYNYKKIMQGGPDFSKFLPNGAKTENEHIADFVNTGLISKTKFSTNMPVEFTKKFLLNGSNWTKILPTAPEGSYVKNETDAGWEMYTKDDAKNTFFVQSERKINGHNLMWKMTKTADGNNVF